MLDRIIFNAQFLKFIIGGVVSALVDIGILHAMISFGIDYIVSVTVGFSVGLIVNYMFHSKLTFRSDSSIYTVLSFLSVVMINYLITVVFVVLSNSLIDSVLVGKIASLPFIAINGYMLSKYWVFKNANT